MSATSPTKSAQNLTVEQMAADHNVQVEKFYSHTLFEPSYILALNDFKPLVTSKDFKTIIPRLGNPPAPLPPPTVKTIAVDDSYFQHHTTSQYHIPTLEELGFSGATLYTNHWVGGEQEALMRLPAYCNCRRQPPANIADSLFDKSSLSPYIRFGCLSVRRFWRYIWDEAHSDNTLQRLAHEVSSKLLQREFFIVVATQVSNFDCITKNTVCLPLPWEKDNELLHLWQTGHTGYPWIDAGIRQMHQEGWVHHVVR